MTHDNTKYYRSLSASVFLARFYLSLVSFRRNDWSLAVLLYISTSLMSLTDMEGKKILSDVKQ